MILKSSSTGVGLTFAQLFFFFFFQRTIRELETELDDIDAQLLDNAERKRKIIQRSTEDLFKASVADRG